MAVKLSGKIKVLPEDFVVEEVWQNGICSIDIPVEFFVSSNSDVCEYLHFTLVKRNWETVKALRYISRKLHMSLKRFGFAGLKDKRAITAQRVSIWHCKAEELARLKLPDMMFKDFKYSDERINLGDALGNRFTVTIRNIPFSANQIIAKLEDIKEYVKEDRLPNYFGPQRMGKDYENVNIGRAILSGDLEEAVYILLKKVRHYMEQGRVEEIPDVFWLEKRVINHLKLQPRDYAGALRKIPKKIRRVFISAFQAQMFNERLAQAISSGKVPDEIEVEGLEVRRMPELSSKAVRRSSYLHVDGFEVIEVSDGIAKIRFKLGRGEYATTFLSYILETID
ncbi:MAG: tRNA pseudouridine(13) synthase TruD [Thermoproteota archaeon]